MNDFYKKARIDIVKYYSENDSVVSIYEYGSVSSPGVSDLDIILVLKDRAVFLEKDLDFNNINKNVYSLVVDGNVIKMPKKVFKKINRFDCLSFQKLFGKDISIEQYDKNYREILDLISTVDWLPERVLRLTKLILQEEINISNALCVLHSFLYSIKKINEMVGDTAGSVGVINLVNKLRSNWYNLNDPEEMLEKCIYDAIELGYQYISILQKHIEQTGHLRQDQAQNIDGVVLELYENCYIRFASNAHDNDLMKMAMDMSNDKYTFVVVSDFYYPHFYCLSQQSGELSNTIRSKIKPYLGLSDVNISKEYESILVNKISLAEDNAVFLRSNGYKKGLLRYGFHFAG
jgi:hypothetical protein